MAIEGIVFNEAGLRELFASEEGAVGRDLARRAILVESQAKLNASHSKPSVPGSGPAVQTGRLRASITWELGRDSDGLFADIGTNVEYAIYLEQGTDRMGARPFLKPALSAAAF